VLAVLSGCGTQSGNRDIIYQTSAIDALLAGDYDGQITLIELKKHGDFGLGTFEALDGELVAFEVPNYMQLWGVARSLGTRVNKFSLDFGKSWELDWEEFEMAVSA
jgi:hypothetical protein